MYCAHVWKRRALSAGMILGLLTASTRARAETIEEREAEQRYNEGNQLFTQGRYAEAVAKFRQAYVVRKTPAVALGLGAATLRSGAALESLGYLREYMADARVSEDGKKKAKAFFDEAYSKTGHVLVTGSATVDGQKVQPAPHEQDVEPGSHEVVCATEPPRVQQIVVKAGQRIDVPCAAGSAALVAPPVAPPRAEPKRVPRDGRPVVVGIVGGLGVASLGTALVTMILAQGAKSDMRDVAASPSDRSDSRSSYDSLRTVSTITTWTGVGLVAAAGVTWFVWPKKTVDSSSGWRVTPVVGVSNLGVAGQF